MTRLTPAKSFVMGFHPTARGFGWVVFESPLKLVSHGVYGAPRAHKNDRCLRRLRWLLSVYGPETLVIEAFDRQSSLRSERIRELCLKVVSEGAERGAYVDCLKRSDVQRAFEAVGASTRDEVAEAVARQIPTLRTHLPGRRKVWKSEDRRLAVFCAAALVLSHYQNGATALLDDLRNAA
jgi:hypothetical protein